ncbi:MAG: hypothetical protein ABIR26_12500 [Ramlibacter sp.]
MHLTLTLQRPLGSEFLEWLVTQIRDREIYRRDIPLAPSATANAHLHDVLDATIENLRSVDCAAFHQKSRVRRPRSGIALNSGVIEVAGVGE